MNSTYVLEYANAPILGLKVNLIISYLVPFFDFPKKQKFFKHIKISPLNNQDKIKILKVLFNNSRDTLSLKDKDNIRYSINKYIDIYNRYINKTNLNKAQQSKLDHTKNILNEIYDYLSNRSVSNTDLSYSRSKIFIINDNFAINKT